MKATIYVVSDSIGETAESVARAAASQFNNAGFEIKKFSHVTKPQEIERILSSMDPATCMVAYTLVVPELREKMMTVSAALGIRAVDIMGPMIQALQQISGLGPWLEPGRFRKIDENYYRKVEAVEFAVKYDDAKDPRGLKLADVVLVGVSRTSKTPVSMYLAYRAIKAANVPLVPEVLPPAELLEVPPGRIVGLTISKEKLRSIRLERALTMGLTPDSRYCSEERITEELQYAAKIFNRLGCAVIDVSNKAVEETASKVMDIIGYEALRHDVPRKT
ncbi:MAG TPA: kinase/pyrophosphorylase [Firmicutes bacterium]|nr:kinase/pyrophosphorylase [Bacillota bacterium]